MALAQPAQAMQSRYGRTNPPSLRYRPGSSPPVTRTHAFAGGGGYTPQQLAFLERMEQSRGMQSRTQPGGVYNDVVKSSSQTTSPEITVQGGSLKTWSYTSRAVERVQVILRTDGRPLDADVELWAGPDNNPHKMRVYLENGAYRPFSCVLETPRGPNTVAVRNIGALEFPISAQIDAVPPDGPLARFEDRPQTIQGGALKTYPFSPNVDSVEVLLRTDGRPLKSRIELLQGPNNNKQVIEIYTEDGADRPFYTVLQTPGSGNVIRIVNTGTVEFPLTASVAAFTTKAHDSID